MKQHTEFLVRRPSEGQSGEFAMHCIAPAEPESHARLSVGGTQSLVSLMYDGLDSSLRWNDEK